MRAPPMVVSTQEIIFFLSPWKQSSKSSDSLCPKAENLRGETIFKIKRVTSQNRLLQPAVILGRGVPHACQGASQTCPRLHKTQELKWRPKTLKPEILNPGLHSFIHSFIQWSIHSFNRPFILSVIHLPIQSIIHLIIQLSIHHSINRPLNH